MGLNGNDMGLLLGKGKCQALLICHPRQRSRTRKNVGCNSMGTGYGSTIKLIVSPVFLPRFATFQRNVTNLRVNQISVRTSPNFRNAYCFSQSENSRNFRNGRANFRAKFHCDIEKFRVLNESSQ